MSWTRLFLPLLVLALFGVFVPWQKGLDFFDALLLLPYSCLSFLFVAPSVIDSCYNNGRTIHPNRLFRGILSGWLWGVALLGTALVTVNLTAVRGSVTLPPRPILLSALVLSLLGCVFVGAAASWTALRASSGDVAKRTMRIAFLSLICLLLFLPHQLSRDAQEELSFLLLPDRLATATLYAVPVLLLIDAAALVLVFRAYTAAGALAKVSAKTSRATLAE